LRQFGKPCDRRLIPRQQPIGAEGLARIPGNELKIIG
jgi:hypothetical protein